MDENQLQKPITDFLRKMAEKGNLETRYYLVVAINTFKYLEFETVTDLLNFDDQRGMKVIHFHGHSYGWKTHNFVRKCFQTAGVKPEDFGRFLQKSKE